MATDNLSAPQSLNEMASAEFPKYTQVRKRMLPSHSSLCQNVDLRRRHSRNAQMCNNVLYGGSEVVTSSKLAPSSTYPWLPKFRCHAKVLGRCCRYEFAYNGVLP